MSETPQLVVGMTIYYRMVGSSRVFEEKVLAVSPNGKTIKVTGASGGAMWLGLDEMEILDWQHPINKSG